MNEQLQKYARDTLKQGLSKCTLAEQTMFKRMYARGKLETPIEEVVDKLEEDKLDWAMQQITNTLRKFNRNS